MMKRVASFMGLDVIGNNFRTHPKGLMKLFLSSTLLFFMIGCAHTPVDKSHQQLLDPSKEAQKIVSTMRSCPKSDCYKALEKIKIELIRKIDFQIARDVEKLFFIEKTMDAVELLNSSDVYLSPVEVSNLRHSLNNHVQLSKMFISKGTTKWNPTFTGCYYININDNRPSSCTVVAAADLQFRVPYAEHFPIKQPANIRGGEKVELVIESLFSPPCKKHKNNTCVKFAIKIATRGNSDQSINFFDVTDRTTVTDMRNHTFQFEMPKAEYATKRDGGTLHGELWVEYTIYRNSREETIYFIWPMFE